MAVTQYVGARYVPLFAGTWNNSESYEPLTVVQYQGNSYTSRQAVPAGIAIANTDYWVQTGTYNAQIEAYRQEVLGFDSRIDALEEVADYETAEKYIAVIGDSFSDCKMRDEGENMPYYYKKEWPEMLAERLGMGLINKAIHGTGFTYPNNSNTNFVGQFRSLLEDANFDKVKYIIIYGGINDWNYNENARVVSAYTSTFSTIAQLYEDIEPVNGEKPQLIVCIGNAPQGKLTSLDGYDQLVTQLQATALRYGLPAVQNVQYWHMFTQAAIWEWDDIHPNSLGQEMIASYMQMIINGSYDGVHRKYRVLGLDGCSNNKSYANFSFDNGELSIDVYLGLDSQTISNWSTTTKTLCTLPASLYYKLGSYQSIAEMSAPLMTWFHEGSSSSYAATLNLAFGEGSGALQLIAQTNGTYSFGKAALTNAGYLTNEGVFTILGTTHGGHITCHF